MRKLLAASALVAVAIAGACSAFGCGDELPVVGEDDGGATEASSSTDAPSTIDGALEDGGGGTDAPSDSTASACDVAQPPGVYYQATFDTNCEGYAVEHGEITPVSDPRRCGVGACRVCVDGLGQPVLYRYIDHAQIEAGTYELRYNLQNDTFDAAALTGTLYIYEEAGATLLGNTSNTRSFVPGQWAQGQIVTNAPGRSTQTLVRFTAPDGIKGCFFIDEVQIGRY